MEPKIPDSIYRILVENSKEAITIISDSKIIYANTVTAKLLGYEKPEEIVGKDAFDYMSPQVREQFKKRITSRLKGESQPERFDHELVRRDGSIVHVETNASLITYGGNPAVLFIARDLTERNQFVSKLFELHKYAALLGSAETLADVSDAALSAITSVMGFKLANFMLTEEDSLDCIDQVGFEKSYWKTPINGVGNLAQAAREKKTILNNDLESYPGLDGGEPDVRSELAAPVLVRGNVEAVIGIESVDRDAFGDSDVQILEVIALHVASALERMESSA